MFRNPIWNFVAAISGVIAIIVSISIYNQQKFVKRLQVEVLSNNPLVSISSEVTSEIQVLYKGTPVKSVSVILLKFSNIGNTPITESDYSEPITLSLSQDAQVGEVTVQATNPPGIDLNPTIVENNIINFKKTLLNPGDQVVIRILALNNDGTLNITGRIAGIKVIEIKSVLGNDTAKSNNTALWIFVFLFGLPIAMGIAVGIWNSVGVKIWRKKKFGFDIGRSYYKEAYEKAFTGVRQIADMNSVVATLDLAFRFDPSYINKVEHEPVFDKVRQYEGYKEMLNKYKVP